MQNFLMGFAWAFNGLIVFFRHERNGRIQLFAGVVVLALGCFYHVSAIEWIVLLGCIASVLSFEMMNSSIEKLCNLLHPAMHPAVKIIKDISAAAVLWVALFSAIIAAIIFLPKMLYQF